MGKIRDIQEYLKNKNIDAYIEYMSDDHGSEYIVDYYKTIKYLTGFTGSSATLVVTQQEAKLWTDGRYYIQAEKELLGTGIELMKSSEESCPTINKFIKSSFISPKIALDFKSTSYQDVSMLISHIEKYELINAEELINKMYENRPALSLSKAYLIDDDNAGETIQSKLNKLQEKCTKFKYTILITALDDIAYLFNLRGSDIDYNPVNYAFSIIDANSCTLYIDSFKLDNSIIENFNSIGINIKPYNDVYKDVSIIDNKILADNSSLNYALSKNIKYRSAHLDFPIKMMKAIKNQTEIANIKDAHIKDAIAMIKFMYYLKSNYNKIYLDELNLASTLEGFRKENKAFLDLSFETICAFKENAAIVHYNASPKTNKEISGSGLLLVDSGAQYKYGTTDITRTFALGEITLEEKHDFTLVLKAHIDLAKTIFKKGDNGVSLDMIARAPLYEEGKDYNHGTGHGIGYLLNVHEGPQSISIHRQVSPAFVPGMITSNEPGLYIENKYGIRHENVILCEKAFENEFGQFYKFDTITLVPFDKDGIDKSLLDNSEINWLNEYHKKIYETISPLLDNNLQNYLKEITKPL